MNRNKRITYQKTTNKFIEWLQVIAIVAICLTGILYISTTTISRAIPISPIIFVSLICILVARAINAWNGNASLNDLYILCILFIMIFLYYNYTDLDIIGITNPCQDSDIGGLIKQNNDGTYTCIRGVNSLNPDNVINTVKGWTNND